MPVTRTDHNQTYDGDGNLVHEEQVEVDITAEAVTYDLHAKLRTLLADAAQAITALQAIEAQADVTITSVSTAQTAVRQMQARQRTLARIAQAHIRRTVALTRLAVDAVDDNADT